jgi:hypothetical protein
MLKLIQPHAAQCLLAFILSAFCWGSMNPAQAGPTRSRFDRSYPSISRIFESDALQTSAKPFEKTDDERLVERWIVHIPPWHHAAMNLKLPIKPHPTGMIAQLPESGRRPVDTEGVNDGGDEDDETTLTDYDYQEWLSATVAPDRNQTP